MDPENQIHAGDAGIQRRVGADISFGLLREALGRAGKGGMATGSSKIECPVIAQFGQVFNYPPIP